jgi:hypothetical protein
MKKCVEKVLDIEKAPPVARREERECYGRG